MFQSSDAARCGTCARVYTYPRPSRLLSSSPQTFIDSTPSSLPSALPTPMCSSTTDHGFSCRRVTPLHIKRHRWCLHPPPLEELFETSRPWIFPNPRLDSNIPRGPWWPPRTSSIPYICSSSSRKTKDRDFPAMARSSLSAVLSERSSRRKRGARAAVVVHGSLHHVFRCRKGSSTRG